MIIIFCIFRDQVKRESKTEGNRRRESRRDLRERIRNFNLKRGERFRIGGWRKRKIIYIFIHLYTEIERKGDVVSVYVCVYTTTHYPASFQVSSTQFKSIQMERCVGGK